MVQIYNKFKYPSTKNKTCVKLFTLLNNIVGIKLSISSTNKHNVTTFGVVQFIKHL